MKQDLQLLLHKIFHLINVSKSKKIILALVLFNPTPAARLGSKADG